MNYETNMVLEPSNSFGRVCGWDERMAANIKLATSQNSFWDDYLDEVICSPVGVHLAVLVEPYLSFILNGTKTIESRFSINRCAPFGSVHEGDIVLLKRSSGPVVGLCRVSSVWNFRLEPKTWSEIRKEFAEALCAQDPIFWDERKGASYATLMKIDNVLEIPPLRVNKRDRRGWVILKKGGHQMDLSI
jgi:hypothetical protein